MAIGVPKGFTIGSMRQVGVFKQNAPVSNDSGGQVDNYSDLVTVRGFLDKTSGNYSIEQGEFMRNKYFKWYCRYNSTIVVDTDTFLEIDGVLYRVLDFELVDEIRHIYVFKISS